jgi:hypothetical protein
MLISYYILFTPNFADNQKACADRTEKLRAKAGCERR